MGSHFEQRKKDDEELDNLKVRIEKRRKSARRSKRKRRKRRPSPTCPSTTAATSTAPTAEKAADRPSARPRSTTSKSSSRGKSTTSTNFVNGSTSSKAWAPRVKAAENAQSRPWPTSVLARTLSSKIKAKLLVTQLLLQQ